MLVLDVNVKNVVRGEETLAECEPLPKTLQCSTPSGGRHTWMEYHGPRPHGGDGIDVRTYGFGYVAVPPTAGYVWNTQSLDRGPGEAPDTWAAFLAARRAPVRDPRGDGWESTGRRDETDDDRELWDARQDDAVEKTLRWYRRRG